MDSLHKFININPYVDKRGMLKKVFMKSKVQDAAEIKEVYLLYSEENSVRGNHYHKETYEYFTVVSGRAKVALKGLHSEAKEEFYLCSDDNVVLYVPPYIIHSFRNEEDQPLIILALSTKEYNETDTDTFAIDIL